MNTFRSLLAGSLLFAGGAAFADDNRWQGLDKPYLAAAHERIHRRWLGFINELARLPPESPYHNPALSVELLLTVEADGTISNVERTRSTGLKGFDDAPVDLIHELGALPPPPPAIRSDDGRAYIAWKFVPKEPGCEERSITERRLPLSEAVPKLVNDGRVDQAAARIADARRGDPAKETELITILTAAVARQEARSPDAQHRAAAASVLGHAPDGEKLLLSLAVDTDVSVRRAALLAIGVHRTTPLGDRARGLLVKALKTDDRVEAARALGMVGERVATEPLRALVDKGEGLPATAQALVAIGARESAVDGINKLLAGDAAARRAAAPTARLLALPELTPTVSLALASPATDEATRLELLLALAPEANKGSADARRAILGRLRDPSVKVRARALDLMGAFGDRSGAMRTRLIDALDDPAFEVRAAAASSLVPVGGAPSVDEIARASRDRAPAVRAAVATALRLHPFEGSKPMLARLEKDADAAVRAAAIAETVAVERPTRAQLCDRLLAQTDVLELLKLAALYFDAPA